MWSVEVGIQRRTEGHKNLVDDLLVLAAATADAAVVVEAAAEPGDDLTSSAIDVPPLAKVRCGFWSRYLS